MRKTGAALTFAISVAAIIAACQPNVDIQTAQYAVNGQKLYVTHCENCHGAKGEGLGTLYPPLTDADYLKKNRDRLPGIVRFGMSGEIYVDGKLYNQLMPPNASLSEVEIAYILTYITTTFGNSTEKFSQQEVHQLLKNKW